MSDYIVHFTKDDDASTAYSSMLSILAEGRIEARGKFGAATNVQGLGDSQRCVCFSEIPLDMLDRLVQRRSRYGIGFHQNTLKRKGGGRVWYLDPETPQKEAFYTTVTEAMTGGIDPGAPIWRLTPFIDYTAPNYQFEWEWEWRVRGDIDFQASDVAFLFVPDEHVNAAAQFLSDGGGGAGPAYGCPILDSLWADERIQDALSHI